LTDLILSLVDSPDPSDPTRSPELADSWFYRDPQGTLQGPFTAQEMAEWFSAGYFTMNLNVKQGRDREFQVSATPFFSVSSRTPHLLEAPFWALPTTLPPEVPFRAIQIPIARSMSLTNLMGVFHLQPLGELIKRNNGQQPFMPTQSSLNVRPVVNASAQDHHALQQVYLLQQQALIQQQQQQALLLRYIA